MDIVEALSFTFVFLKCCNLSQNIFVNKSLTFRTSRVLEIFWLLVLLFSMAMLLSGLFDYKDLLSKSSDNDIARTADSIQLFGIRAAHLVTICEAYAKRNNQSIFISQVREIDRIFECSLNIDVDNGALRRLLLRRGSIMFCIYFFCEICILISHLVAGNHYFMIYWFLYLLPFFVCGLRYFQTFVAIIIVRTRLETLVSILNNLDLLNKKKAKSPTVSDKIPDSVHIIGHTLPLFEIPEFENQRYDIENPDIKRLLVVRDVYNRLWELTDIINNSFGISLLVNVANDFICITSNCYWIFLNFKSYSATLADLMRIISSIVWFVPHLLNVLALTLLCEGTVQQTTAIALGLHRIETNIWNDNQNTVIEQFSLQLLHQKLSFSAAGFFEINCTLLYTIAGATTTYLIILIQFHMSEQKI